MGKHEKAEPDTEGHPIGNQDPDKRGLDKMPPPDSTRSEIEYAQALGKPVRYLEPPL